MCGGNYQAVLLSIQLENIRRKHNYLPLIMEVLKILAKKGQLVTLVEQVGSAHYIYMYVCTWILLL